MTTKFPRMPAVPIPLLDNLVENVWGGDWIARFKNRPLDGRKIGESWEFSGHPDHPGTLLWPDGSIVSVPSLFGEESPGLLLKFIDACENLSIQVHPSDDYARRHEKSAGKSESWLVLSTGRERGEGFIYLGFNRTARARYKSEEDFRAAFEQACRSGSERDILPFINKLAVKPGDVFNVLPGTVHAIGKGVRIFEVQQSSGITYRLWDWGRTSRSLHLEKGMDVLNFSARLYSPERTKRISDGLGHYDAEIIRLKKTERRNFKTDRWEVITVLDGMMQMSAGPAGVVAGHSVFVPKNVSLEIGAANAPVWCVRSWTKARPLSS